MNKPLVSVYVQRPVPAAPPPPIDYTDKIWWINIIKHILTKKIPEHGRFFISI